MKSIVLKGYGTQHLGVEGGRGMIIRAPKGWVTSAIERMKFYSHLSCIWSRYYINTIKMKYIFNNKHIIDEIF